MTTQIPAVVAFLAALACSDSHEASSGRDTALTSTRTAEAPAPEVSESRTAEEAFARGRQLMEQHCADCYKRSLAGALEAVNELQRAIALGRNDAEVHRLLRDAYAGIAFVDYGSAGEEAENRRYVDLMNEEIRIVAKLDPADLENRMRYVELLDSKAKRAELNEIAARFPKHAFTRYRLAQSSIEDGDAEGAAANARQWLALADPAELDEYSGRLFESASEERLKRVIERDPKLHPAAFELATRALREGRDANEGLAFARAALESAPPIVANGYLSALDTLLTSTDKHTEAAALRSEYSAKAKSGETQRQQLH
jgi:hypothetical protein